MDPRREMQLVANGMQSELLADAPAACESEARDIARLRQTLQKDREAVFGNLPKKAAKRRGVIKTLQPRSSHEVTSPADALVE